MTIYSSHYYNKYIKFINSCKEQQIVGYKELHHIIPKALEGSNDKSNLINLTARQHYLAHWMLWKAYNIKSMHDAFWMMNNVKSDNQERHYKINSKIYNTLKEERSRMLSIEMSLNNPSKLESVKELRRLALLGNTYGKKNKGMVFTEEHRKNLSNSHKGKQTSDNQKSAVAKANTRRKGTNPTAAAVEKIRIKCFCEGVVYNSITEAQMYYTGINLWKRLDKPKYPEFYRIKNLEI